LRAWHAVALVNALLVAAVAIGGWQVARRAATAQADQAITWGGPEGEWRDIDGVVRAVLPEVGIIVLTHADIPGVMPGMTMGFRAAMPNFPSTLSVGDAVRFTVRGSPPLVEVTAIEKF
jgi:Cu/Ag efflux protein CusF